MNKARILFVDDEKRVLNSMRGLFRRDYDLFLASEGAEAVRIAAENKIDVIVADQRMPGMTGIEVLAKIKEQSPRTVRILLTGYADPSAVEGSINIGEVFRFLSKPCPPKMLRETLGLAIEASRTQPVTPTVSPPAAVTSAGIASVAPVHDDDETQPALRALDESAVRSVNEQSSSHWQSVTNVVMSEDTVEETQETVALTASTLALKDVGVVVFTVDSEFASTAIRAVSADRNVALATSLLKVAQTIEQQNTGVLVTDFTSNKQTLQRIIGALKQQLPELVTIVISDGRDTTDMINLINYGQVFRYVLKPVEPAQLRSDISAAVMQHLYLLNNPDSVKRHSVIGAPETANSSATLNRFLGKIRAMPSRRIKPTDTIA